MKKTGVPGFQKSQDPEERGFAAAVTAKKSVNLTDPGKAPGA
jgi:hypothetical protein